MTKTILATILGSAAILLPTASVAEVRLPHVLSDHMVLQRDEPIHLWGWATPGERVSAQFDKVSAETVADPLGHWSLFLKPHAAGGPYTLSVRGSNEITLSDVLVGDVWIASGQSNMEMPLAGFPGSAVLKNSDAEIAQASHADIRLLQVHRISSNYPLDEVTGTWTPCTPETARSFSAVAYFFGREIAQHEHVPVGLVDTTWGGTPAESWVSMDGLGSDPSLAPVFTFWGHFADQQRSLKETIAAEKSEDDQAKRDGRPTPKHPWHPSPDSWAPAGLFNGMIAPLTPMTMRGVIWYQGETNSGLERVALYHPLFAKLIEDWRAKWNEGDFPFLFTQISSFKSNDTEAWGELRDAQRRTLSVAHTAMAVTLDVGNPDNVHPADKQTVGHRLALAALATAYGESAAYEGPLYRRSTVEGNAMRVWFQPTVGALHCAGDCAGFEVAGTDRRFKPAMAQVDGSSVVVHSPEVAAPRFVRYAWPNAPAADLTNAGGLPASTFTSEDAVLSR